MNKSIENVYKINSWEKYLSEYKRSVENPEKFWDSIASTFIWKKKWSQTLHWNFTEPNIQWFINGKLNITENCLDRHLEEFGEKLAIIWEPNDPKENSRTITYTKLHAEVCKFANVLKKHGVVKGDRVCIYMPMVPELTVAMLACARIGAIHSVVFAGFSANSLKERINDASCKIIVTSDGLMRGDKRLVLKDIVDEALNATPTIKKCIVYQNTGDKIEMEPMRDFWWQDEISTVKEECPAEAMDSEDMLFILYTSGSTGKPKGVVHTTGGYMVYVYYTFLNAFHYTDSDIYWCTADIGWITGHSYTVYGPLLNGSTVIMFEGVPTWPDPGRFWAICDKYKVTKFYTAPTAIRSLMTFGEKYPRKYNLDSLKILGTVGEPINEEAWKWYRKEIGKGKCPIVDTWWQTETGGICISPIPGVTKEKPSYVTLPLPGIQPVIIDTKGNILPGDEIEGLLCIKFPWPGIIRTTFGDHQRCKENYFSAFPGLYFTGDGCRRDKDGYYRIIGRVDDVINVSGHRLGTAEIESAINEHEKIIESAVVGYAHEIKGQGIIAFVISTERIEDQDAFVQEVRATVSKIIGPIAKPDKVIVVDGLPKTRSGKIMRRILRKIAEGESTDFGDTSTLLDPSVIDRIVNASI